MTRVVKEMKNINNQMRDVQETSVAVHHALCSDTLRKHHDEHALVERCPETINLRNTFDTIITHPGMSPKVVDDNMCNQSQIASTN